MKTKALQSANPGAVTAWMQGAFARLFAASASLRTRARNAGEVAEFVDWQVRTFGAAKVSLTREQLWESLLSSVGRDEPLTVLEFGVAWGYATQWWLARLPGDARLHGFDRFTGLPRAWREYDAGAFAADGTPPAIDDPRVTWHVGDVEKTMHELDLTALAEGRRLVLFDLDIYEPTAAAWTFLAPHLRSGDLLYFDEAFADDERRVLDELVLPHGAVEYIGSTALALALRVT